MNDKRAFSVDERLRMAMIGSCSCVTKTPEPDYHALDCPFAAMAKACDLIGYLRAEVERQREALTSIAEYWNGTPEAAVDAAEEAREWALATLNGGTTNN